MSGRGTIAIEEKVTVETGELWTLDDLERLWKPPMSDPKRRRQWIWRRIHAWGVPHDGDRYHPRFLPGEVMRATNKHLGRKGK